MHLGALGRHQDAVVLLEEALELRKAKLGLDHADTLSNMHELAESLINCNRGTEAVPLIDDCIGLAAGKLVAASFVPKLVATSCAARTCARLARRTESNLLGHRSFASRRPLN